VLEGIRIMNSIISKHIAALAEMGPNHAKRGAVTENLNGYIRSRDSEIRKLNARTQPLNEQPAAP